MTMKPFGLVFYWPLYKEMTPTSVCFFDPAMLQRPAFIVQLLSPGSKVVFWAGSHLIETLNPTKGPLMTSPVDRIPVVGVRRVEVDMNEGGLYVYISSREGIELTLNSVIFDGRLSFAIENGIAITMIYRPKDRMAKHLPMELPNLIELKNMVEQMEAQAPGMQFHYKYK
jgi:hypothetical protein